MDSLIAKLRVALQLDSAAFETGAKRASAEVNALGSRAEKAGFAIGSMGKALIAGGAVLAASAIVSNLKQAVSAGLDYAASLGETAQQLGVTTKTLQEYRYAADQVGISQDEMDNGLAKLTRTIGLAVEENNKQASAFEKLGISVRDANGHVKDAGDIIPELAGALQNLGSPAERAAVLVDLFGKSGQKMGSLLADGAKGVNSLRQDAEKLGIVMSDALIAKADAASDKMASLNKVITAKIAIAVAENADAIIKLAEAFGVLIDKIGQAVSILAKFLNAWNLAKPGLKEGLLSPSEAKGLSNMGKRFGIFTPNKTTTTPSAPSPSSGGALLRLPGNGGTFTPGNGPLANFAGSGILRSAANDLAGFAPGLLNRGNFVQSVVLSINEVTDAADEAAAKTDVATVRIARSFGEMSRDAIGSLKGLIGAIKSGDFGDILTSVLNIGLQIGQAGGFGSKAASFLASVPAFAGGTSFAPGGLALVGERGPELVNLPRGAQVYPNGTGPGGGGGTFHFDLRGAVMTQDLLNQMNMIGVASAQAGGEIGFGKVARANSRTPNW